MDPASGGLLRLPPPDVRRHDALGAEIPHGAAAWLPSDRDHAGRPPVHRPARRRVHQSRVRRRERKGQGGVAVGAGTVSLDQLRRIAVGAGAGPAQRLNRFVGRSFPRPDKAAFDSGSIERRSNMRPQRTAIAAAAALLVWGHTAWAGEAEAKKWIDSEFQPSTLSKDKQQAEMKWFIDAAKKLMGKGVKEISVVSETITTHEYESKTLAKAFEEITGIKVKHDIIQEGDVVEKLQTSMQSGKSIYDGWISDSDLIGTHYRYGVILPLSDYMAGAGKEWSNLGLDIKDFIGTSIPTAPSTKPNSPPAQHFMIRCGVIANLFARKD